MLRVFPQSQIENKNELLTFLHLFLLETVADSIGWKNFFENCCCSASNCMLLICDWSTFKEFAT